MSADQPYRPNEDWNDLPLPSQDSSWEKMEALLDKEEKRRILPPFFLNCAGIALISAVLIGAAWFAFRPGGFLDEKNTALTEQQAKQDNSTITATEKKKTANKSNLTGIENPATVSEDKRAGTDQNETEGNSNNNGTVHSANAANKNAVLNKSKRIISEPADTKSAVITKTGKTGKEKQTKLPVVNADQPIATVSQAPTGSDLSSPVDTARATPKNNLAVTTTDNQAPQISAKADSATTNAISTTGTEKFRSKSSVFSYSAGLGIQQQLRNGEQLPYSAGYYGNQSWLSEHIPSVYFRVHHKQNWFAQAEFRFGAPQLVKDYSYAKQIRYDTASSNLVVSTMRVKKLYYHQIPVSFNYNLLPRFSVGAGGVYSLFYRAVTEQENKSTNVFTGAESFSKNTQRIPGFRDSFFFKSQVQLIFNTDYRWKNFSLGLRYKKDLQPYIKYTRPDGTVTEDLNDAIEVILRYRLWKSKK